MAIVTSGPIVGFSGTVGGMTYYQLKDGRTVVKQKNRKSSKPASAKQIAAWTDTGIVAQFVRPFQKFIQVSYKSLAAQTYDNPHNAMVSEIRKSAMDGAYPNRKVNLQKLLVSKGDLLSAVDQSVKLTAEGLHFKWNTETQEGENHRSDLAMLLAYFPELKLIKSDTAGAKRSAGEAKLSLLGVKKGYVAEVYISFITSDHERVSNSTYLGQFNW